MSNSIIEQSDPGIVAKETPVRLSDEKLKNMLLALTSAHKKI